MREILAKARELNGLEMDEVAVLSSVSDPELLGELFDDGARRQGRHLRRAPRALRPALHLQPLQQRLPLLRLPRAQQGAQAARPHAGGDPPRGRAPRRPGSQAHPARGRRVLPQAGLRLRARLDRDHLRRSSAATARSAASTSTWRRSPWTSSSALKAHRHRHLPALPGDLPPRDLRSRARGRQEEGLRLARHRHAPRHGGRHRRRRHRRALRPLRLALRDPRAHAARARARARLRRRPAHHQHAAPRAGHRLGHGRATRRSR